MDGLAVRPRQSIYRFWLSSDRKWPRMSYLERFRGRIRAANDEDATEYVCRGCGAGFDERWQVCPECGGYSVRRREWKSE